MSFEVEMKKYIRLLNRHYTENFEFDRPYAEAYLRFLLEEIQKHPYHLRAYNQIAIMMMELSCEDYILFLKKAVDRCKEKANPDVLAMCYSNIGYFYIAQEDRYEEAEPYLLEAIRLSDRFDQPFAMLSKVYFEKQDYEKACDFAQAALEVQNGYNNICNYAACLAMTKDYPAAYEIYQSLCENQPFNSQTECVKFVFASLCCAVGDVQNAMQIADEIMQCKQLGNLDRDVDYADAGYLYFQCGAYEKAKLAFERSAFSVSDEYLEAYYYCCCMCGDFNAAETKLFSEIAMLEEAEREKEEDEPKEDLSKKIDTKKETFDRIVKNGEKPVHDFKSTFIWNCLLIECPRHWNFEN